MTVLVVPFALAIVVGVLSWIIFRQRRTMTARGWLYIAAIVMMAFIAGVASAALAYTGGLKKDDVDDTEKGLFVFMRMFMLPFIFWGGVAILLMVLWGFTGRSKTGTMVLYAMGISTLILGASLISSIVAYLVAVAEE